MNAMTKELRARRRILRATVRAGHVTKRGQRSVFAERGSPMFVRLAATILSLASVTACTSGGQSTGIEPLSCAPDSTLTYATYGKDAITTNCMSCHDKEGPVLGTQAQVQTHASKILDAAVYTDSMPEDGTMTIEERRKLGEWLACGAP